MPTVSQTQPLLTRPSTTKLLLAFASIYLIWGSTYLAIRYAVETIPPLIAAGVRHFVAGSVLFAYSYRRGYRPTWREVRAALLIGALYFLVGHGTLHWAEQRVASGLAALLIATEPMFIAGIQVATRKERFSLWTLAGLLSGIAGVGLLVGGDALHADGQLLGIVMVLLGSLAWSAGVCTSRSVALPKDPVASAAITMFFGALMLLTTSAVTGEWTGMALSHLSTRSLGGLLYLIVFGSLVAFTAYVWLLDHCSPTIVSTHTYVNPVVAMILGWFFAGEPVTHRVILAALAILASLGLIRQGTRAKEERRELSVPQKLAKTG